MRKLLTLRIESPGFSHDELDYQDIEVWLDDEAKAWLRKPGQTMAEVCEQTRLRFEKATKAALLSIVE